jgi:mannose-6-phosphate isomerase-like protein (cupin superfamily)
MALPLRNLPPPDVPPLQPSFVVLHRCGGQDGDSTWTTGRVDMLYRDLVPGGQGGRFIASHIRISGDGPVPDYVHFHRVRFQMIYCRRGRARVVYEDQGPPFELTTGDCVVQPPGIRHQVLESAGGLEVVELTCPAEHETFADDALALPTEIERPAREFAGQRFVRHVAATAPWRPGPVPGFTNRDLGIGAATDGLAGARVLRRDPAGGDGDAARTVPTTAELAFTYVLAGTAVLRTGRHGEHAVGPDDAFVVPPGESYRLSEPADDLELLEVTLPA